jgi:DNA-binding IclR family transcriptional regulator
MNALGRALAVIDAVLQYPHPVSTPDLVEHLGEARGTVHRWLQQLEEEGLLLRDPRGHIGVGPRLSALSLAVLRSRNQGAPVRALLQSIVDEIAESCSIGVLDGRDYTIIDLCESPGPLRSNLAVGSRARAHCLAGGKIMLADLDARSLKRLLGTGKLEACTSRTITRRAALEAGLAKVRRRGFALNNEESLQGVVAVAVPIRDTGGRIVAALTVHGPKPRLSLNACKSHVPRLQRTAERIGRIWFPRRCSRSRN